ncbi:MAG: Trp biosynthesis associated, transrane protein Oprn/Chp, partial [Modestobacter sp.]|nr:Trp biosynthesis associated, transrane protein Oprn/Chp [Modestobacter sp.]
MSEVSTAGPPARSRRELTVAVLLCALSGGLALSSSSQPWADVTITRPAPLPPTSEVLTGSQAAPLVAACGLLLLAAAVAVIAVRGIGRVVVGLLVAVAAGALGWSGLRGVTGGLHL